MPLAKKINQMNIEYDRQRQRQATGGSGSSSVSPQNETPDLVPAANSPEFLAKYPFKESPYYNSNLLLSSLYQERVERNPHLRHNPS